MSGSIEEFDDDTDFALPTVPAAAPAQGGAGAAGMPAGMSMDNLQQMMAQMQGGGGGAGGSGGPSGMPPGMMNMFGGGGGGASLPPKVELSSEEKKYITVYPIYFDAKRRYEKGCRRVAYAHACMWPKSESIEKAAQRLTLMHAHEGRKAHPRDWENPGRVKIQLFNGQGEPLHQKYKTKKDLLRAIAEIIQPQCGGTPPPLPAHPKQAKEKKVAATAATAATTMPKKNKAVEKASSKEQPYKNAKARQSKAQHRLPIRIDAKDRIKADNALQKERRAKLPGGRLPAYSPCKEAGMLNADLGGMMGGLEGMGPLGAMMGSMGLGGDDDEDNEDEAEQESQADKKKKDPLQQLSRRQRKRVVRVGR